MFFRDIETKLKRLNPDELLSLYCDDAKNHLSEIAVRKIDVGSEFFRGRIGKQTLKCAIDDCDIDLSIPFFGESISAPKPVYCSEGRFNRDGFSFLYLSSDPETCCAEIKLEVGQIASIAKFNCVKAGTYIDLTESESNKHMDEVREILLQPVHHEIRHVYRITQFISDIFRRMGYSGIIFDSTVTLGENVVVFSPSDYSFINYSDSLYTARKIDYTIDKVPEKIYNDIDNLLNSYNENEEGAKEALMEYTLQKYQSNSPKGMEESRKL